ncbi:MAG: hypothetical protein WCX84_01780 [Syntrophales bacterium]|jgi:hypothetical protein|nr:hypothetical protein [Syntrophales bacterium]NLN59650.1 hypothetical protein [Deltaproteobacteria bacterium]
MKAGCKSIYPLGLVILGIIFLFGCAGAVSSLSSSSSGAGMTYKRIAVLRFTQANPADTIDKLMPSDIALQGERDVDSPEKIVETIFLTRLGENRDTEIIPVEETEGVYRQLTTKTISPKEIELIGQLGKALKVDAIVVGYVYRYMERVGTSYAVEKPASVAFEIHLIDVKAGIRTWRATFDKTQRSLMENLFNFRFFVKDRGRWITARELAEEGIDQVMQNFPGTR